MKQALQLRLSQHLALTPQLQQSIRLLQLSTLELNAEIEQALQDNPLLEREELGEPGFTPGSGINEAPQPVTEAESRGTEAAERSDNEGAVDEGWGMEMGGSRNPRDPNDEDMDSGDTQAAEISLREHLTSQLGLTQLTERDRALVGFLIEALDNDGYLAQTLDELIDLLLPSDEDTPEVEPEYENGEGNRERLLEDLGIALRHLQNLDPPGVGARGCQECLALQLRSLPPTPERELALAVVDKHLEQFAARDFVRIKKALGCDDEMLREAQSLIRSLNPRPGAHFATLDTRYVVPDVSVRKLRGSWVCTLNGEAMPRLRINRLYADILQRQRGGGGSAAGLATQLQEAKWLIKNVQQRFDTILRVSQAIVDRQRAFFDHGDVAMRPLTLREIAETVSLHESTISRVTTQKYLASPRGIFELKYFFGSHVATDSGGAASSTAIRALIKQLIGAENGKKPLSDSRLAEILGEQGIVVARRTVAKYRELLNIPPVNLRKTL
jgi:RNA polymerase sigma-54 factor